MTAQWIPIPTAQVTASALQNWFLKNGKLKEAHGQIKRTLFVKEILISYQKQSWWRWDGGGSISGSSRTDGNSEQVNQQKRNICFWSHVSLTPPRPHSEEAGGLGRRPCERCDWHCCMNPLHSYSRSQAWMMILRMTPFPAVPVFS